MPAHTSIPATAEARADGISDRRLHTQVRDFMLAQLAHIHNTDATLAVARKLGL